MWFLSQNGQQYGPYSQPQMEQMIAAGQVRSGFVCAEGQQDWVSLDQHPTFSRLLGAAPSAGGGKRLRLALVVLGVLLVVGIGIGIARQLMMGSTGQLARVLPSDVQLYAEVADIPGAIEALQQMEIIEGERIDLERYRGKLVDGLQDAFEIDKDTAKALVGDLESVAFGMRKLGDRSSKEEAVLIVAFDDADAVETLLKTKRFHDEGVLGGTGQRYSLWRVEAEAEQKQQWSAPRRFFADMRVEGDDERKALVWFPKRSLLVLGHPGLVADMAGVMEDGKASLATSDAWKKADFESGAQSIAYLDPLAFRDDPSSREWAGKVLDGVAGITFSLEIEDAGVVTTMAGELRGSALPKDGLSSAPKLQLFRRLPATTLGYLSISTHSERTGRELRDEMVSTVRDYDDDAARELDRGLDEMRDELGVGIEDLWDAMGDELVIAGAVAEDLRIDADRKPEEYLEQVAGGIVMHVGQREVAVRLVELLRRKAFVDTPLADLYGVVSEGDGFIATPKGSEPLPQVRVVFVDDVLVMVVGGKSMCGRFVEAMSGSGDRLGDVAAHDEAMDTMSSGARLYAWFDVGRTAYLTMSAMPDLAETLAAIERETGLSPTMLVLQGDHRLGFALAFHLDTDGEVWRYKIESLNMPLLGVATGLAAYRAAREASKQLEELQQQQREMEAELERIRNGR